METVDPIKTEQFLREFTELSIKHKMGIAGPFDIFMMEDDDFERTYHDDGRGKYELAMLHFA